MTRDSIPEKHIHVEGHGKSRVNWWRDGKMGVTYFGDPNSTEVLGHAVLPEDDDRIEFKYGEFEPDEVRTDIRDQSFEELKERLKKKRENRIHANSTKKKKSKKQSTSKSKSQKSDDKDNIADKLKNLSEEEKKLMKELMSDD